MKKYYFYVIEFDNGNDVWEIKDVTTDKDDFSDEKLLWDFDEETNPKLNSFEEITKEEFDVLVRFL